MLFFGAMFLLTKKLRFEILRQTKKILKDSENIFLYFFVVLEIFTTFASK